MVCNFSIYERDMDDTDRRLMFNLLASWPFMQSQFRVLFTIVSCQLNPARANVIERRRVLTVSVRCHAKCFKKETA